MIEDGLTLTHGEMTFGAGVMAAWKFGAAELVDPRPYLKGRLNEVIEKYRGIGNVLPTMGYSSMQIMDLEDTINHTDCWHSL